MRKSFVLIILLNSIVSIAQQTGTITDARDGKIYKTVVLGTQTWMAENLNVDRFRNGDAIPQVKTDEEWIKAGEEGRPAWCYYDNDTANGTKYGKLYNWYVLNDKRGLAPEGWSIATYQQWQVLSSFLVGEEISEKKLKSIDLWNVEKGSNEPAFSGIRIGQRGNEMQGQFINDQHHSGCWWTPQDFNTNISSSFIINNDYNLVMVSLPKSYGLSLRCIKKWSSYPQVKGSFTDSRDGKVYKTVTIGFQTWMSENLNVTTFRNGDSIPEARTKQEWERAGENKQSVWCYYDNDPMNGAKYGKLYNWYAVNDTRGLAPVGWHIPIEVESEALHAHLGGGDDGMMKSTSGWNNFESITCSICKEGISENDKICWACKGTGKKDKKTLSGNGTNSSGFSGLPGGIRSWDANYKFLDGDQGFHEIGNSGYWWCASEHDNLGPMRMNLFQGEWGGVEPVPLNKQDCLSVRCLKN